jgi:hypothetical protein
MYIELLVNPVSSAFWRGRLTVDGRIAACLMRGLI